MNPDECSAFDLVCQANGIVSGVWDTITGAPASFLGWAADNTLGVIAESVGQSMQVMLTTLTSWWAKTDFVDVAQSGDVTFIQSSTRYLVVVAAVVSVLIAAGQIMWTQRGEPFKKLLASLMTLVVVSGIGVVAIDMLTRAGDSFAYWILNQSTKSGFNADSFGFMYLLSSGVGPMIIILTGIGGLIVTGIQIMLLFVRSAFLILIAGVLPLAMAATNTSWGRQWATKVAGWTAAFVLFKPTAAIILALSIRLLGNESRSDFASSVNSFNCAEGDVDCLLDALGQITHQALVSGADDIQSGSISRFLMGFVLLCLSVAALPALMKFAVPASEGLSGGGGGAMGALVGAGTMVVATGAMMKSAAGKVAGGGSGALPSGGSPGPGSPPGHAPAASGAGTSSGSSSTPGPSRSPGDSAQAGQDSASPTGAQANSSNSGRHSSGRSESEPASGAHTQGMASNASSTEVSAGQASGSSTALNGRHIPGPGVAGATIQGAQAMADGAREVAEREAGEA